MSGDEAAVLIAGAALTVVSWSLWYSTPIRIRRLGRPASARGVFLVAPLAALATIGVILRTAAASDVRDSPLYLSFYGLMGAAWLGLSVHVFPLLGISPRDDVIERDNASAAYAVAGALMGLALAFAGGNVGDGPGWWVVLFSSGLATLTVVVLWLILESATGVSEAITVDRDRAAGIRLAGFLLATGAICGRAAAGNWISAQATVRDFVGTVEPVFAVLAIAIVTERFARPRPGRPTVSVFSGAIVAVAYVAIAMAHVYLLGAA